MERQIKKNYTLEMAHRVEALAYALTGEKMELANATHFAVTKGTVIKAARMLGFLPDIRFSEYAQCHDFLVKHLTNLSK